MSTPTTPTPSPPSGYALISGTTNIVLPVDIAMQVFKILCKGEPIEYDWNTKTYKRRVSADVPTLQMFSVAQYATLSLEDDA